MKKILTVVIALMLAAVACAAFAENAEKPYVTMLAKGFQHAYWQTVKAGGEAAAEKYGVTINFDGPSAETEIDEQVNKLKEEMSKHPAVITLAAMSADAVKTELQECLEQKIPIVAFDNSIAGAPEGSVLATVATNNEKAAAIAADKLFENPKFKEAFDAATPEKPIVIGAISQDAVSGTHVARVTGFVNEMVKLCSATKPVAVEGHEIWKKPAENAAVIIHVQISATSQVSDVANASEAVLNMDNLKAVFLCNEGAVTGFLAATADGSDLAPGGTYGDVIVVGFDSGAPQKNAVRNGWFMGSVSQDPYATGYKTIELAAKVIKGEKVEDIEVPAKWYDASNIDSDEIKPLLYD